MNVRLLRHGGSGDGMLTMQCVAGKYIVYYGNFTQPRLENLKNNNLLLRLFE